MAEANGNTADLKTRFLQIYYRLKSELLEDPAFSFTDDARQWIDRMLEYNVPGGKLNRGISVVDSYKILKGGQLTDDEFFLASVLGWCIEWLQAYFLVLDDIMDNSHTRRGQPCWFRVPKVGLIAANDGILLRNHVPRILKRHFGEKAYYVHLLDIFNEIEFQTASGQMLDLITTHEGEKDLSKYTMLVYDDYLDCFGDPEFIGKIGTDIEDFKCSWLVVKALEIANENQMKILSENYGKSDPACVAKIKALYKDLNLEPTTSDIELRLFIFFPLSKAVFSDYEKTSYRQLISSIEAQPSKAVQEVLKSFLQKIYKRQK
ncbi:Farnesyl pyrophosphate synthase 1 [Apostasia shenzhenica]|uniref:Farnesyl pyrophosphate synthase 1 n=1 Tax=Apostasia shenzhenica TaxID=1088818 RepID=A0A2I0B117_9ASPA|nr:Farnesyl pyrophosphate synthase 1 [Apostasia shenzhenica]